MKEIYNDEQIAAIVGVSASTVRRWRLGQKQIPRRFEESLEDFQPTQTGWVLIEFEWEYQQ